MIISFKALVLLSVVSQSSTQFTPRKWSFALDLTFWSKSRRIMGWCIRASKWYRRSNDAGWEDRGCHGYRSAQQQSCVFLCSHPEKLTFKFHSGWLCKPGRCVGDTTAVTRLGVPSLCFEDGPAGMRLTKNVTGFPAGINVASTFSRRLMRARGKAMAEEFRGKGAQWVLWFQWRGTPTYAAGSVLLGPALDIVSLIIPWILLYVVMCSSF